MDRIEAVKRYIALATREPRAKAEDRTPQPFVTISRDSGAGGMTLATQLVESLAARGDDDVFQGWEVFDQELCERVADDPELKVGLRSLLAESSLNAVEDKVAVMLGRSPQSQIQRSLIETIRELAVVGKSVIVGRGAAGVTDDLPLGIHVRLVAPLEVRVARKSAELQIAESEAKKLVNDRDRNRASFVRRLCNRDVEDPLLYHAVWNTAWTPMDVIAGSVVEWVDRLRNEKG